MRLILYSNATADMTNPILLLSPMPVLGKVPYVNMQTMMSTSKSAVEPPVEETSDCGQVLSVSTGGVKSPLQCDALEVTSRKHSLMSFLLPFNNV